MNNTVKCKKVNIEVILAMQAAKEEGISYDEYIDKKTKDPFAMLGFSSIAKKVTKESRVEEEIMLNLERVLYIGDTTPLFKCNDEHQIFPVYFSKDQTDVIWIDATDYREVQQEFMKRY